ncbi:resolvase [Vibrio crassostreae 9CS106]|nr:resolvase [Vibrio crassostreae 9CS106]
MYARVSTDKQNLEPQKDELQKAYQDAELVEEKASGKDLARDEFIKLNDKLQAGDTVIIYDLSRLGRNTTELLALVDNWKVREVNLIIHNLGGQTIDTGTATGYFMFTLLSAVGQMQKDIQAEKAALGMAKAVADGKMKGGVPHKTKQIEKALKLLDENGLTKEEAAKAAGIGVATLYRAIKIRKQG